MDRHGSQVRVEPEVAAQGEQRLLGADGRRGIGPLRPADRAQEDGIDRRARLDVLGPDRDTIGVDRATPGEDLRPDDLEAEPPAGGLDDATSGIDDFGADPVARDRRRRDASGGLARSRQAVSRLLIRKGHGDAVDVGPVQLVGPHEIGVERRFDDVRA